MKNKQKTFLIINLAYIGDVMVSSPLCENIKKYFPDSKLIYITTPLTKQIVEGIPFVDDVYVFNKRKENKGLLGIFNFIKDFKYWGKVDYCFPILSYDRSFLLSFLLGCKRRISMHFEHCVLRFLLTDKVIPNCPHIIDILNSLLLEIIDKKAVLTREMRYEPTSESIEKAKTLIKENDYDKYDLIALCTNTKLAAKDWNADDAADFIKEVNESGKRVVLVGDKSARELVSKVKEKIGETFLDLTEKTDLATLGAVYKCCKAQVSVDTGPMHIGIAAGVPTVSMFFYPDIVSEWEPIDKEKHRLILKPEITGRECFEKLQEII